MKEKDRYFRLKTISIRRSMSCAIKKMISVDGRLNLLGKPIKLRTDPQVGLTYT